MGEVKLIKSACIFPAIRELLQEGTQVWLTVTGMSMYPFLREDKDSVKLVSACFDTINKGDIVLIQRVSGEYILHRVFKKDDNCFFMAGDAQKWIEGPLEPDRLIAAVAEIRRNGRTISCRNIFWNLLTAFWMKAIPLRNYLLKTIRILAKMKCNFRCYRP